MPNSIVLPNDFEAYAKFLPDEWEVSKAPRLENLLQIYIKDLSRHGVLSDHLPHNMKVMHYGEPAGVIELQASHDFLAIRTSQQGQSEQHIAMTQTACNFGGYRQWFMCPDCGRRVGVLYLQNKFTCRHCTHLKYESQYKSESSRLFAKARKIRRSLGGTINMSEPLPNRPKGMHVTTYLRHVENYARAASKAKSAIGF